MHRRRGGNTEEASVADADHLALAVRLAIEVGRDEHDLLPAARIASIESTMREALLACVPALGASSDDLAHTLVALVVTAGAANARVSPDDLWRQGGPVVRSYLVDAGVDAAKICEVFDESR